MAETRPGRNDMPCEPPIDCVGFPARRLVEGKEGRSNLASDAGLLDTGPVLARGSSLAAIAPLELDFSEAAAAAVAVEKTA